ITALRALEEEGVKGRAREVILRVSNVVALYMLNNKRAMLADMERRYEFTVLIRVDENLPPSGFAVEAGKGGGGASAPARPAGAPMPAYDDTLEEGGDEAAAGEGGEAEGGGQPQQDRYNSDRGG